MEVTLLEGNSSNRVKDTRHWDDVLSLTPQGSDWIGSGKKIYGFGIDLNSRGQPIYDTSRLHWVHYQFVAVGPPTWPVVAKDPVWEQYKKRIPRLVGYAKMLHEIGEPNVTCSSPKLEISGIPDGQNTQWYFPKGFPGGVEIDIDLLDVYPLPTKGIELRWDGSFVPSNYRVQFAGAQQQYKEAIVPDLSKVPAQSPSIPVPVMFTTSGTGVEVRYIKLIFPSTFQQDAILQELRFRYYQGPLADTEVCQYTLVGDLDGNCRVDFSDFALMAAN